MLIAVLSLHRLRQESSYVNSESSGNISNWKKAPFVLSCFTVRGQRLEISINLVPSWGYFTPFFFFTCKEMEMFLHWSLEWMPTLHYTVAIWRLHSPWHLLLPASFGLRFDHHSVTSQLRLNLLYVLPIEKPRERLMRVFESCHVYVLSCNYIIERD